MSTTNDKRPAMGPAGAMPALLDEIAELRAQLAAERAIKAELVAALEAFVRPFDGFTGTVSSTMKGGRAALARAKEVQP